MRFPVRNTVNILWSELSTIANKSISSLGGKEQGGGYGTNTGAWTYPSRCRACASAVAVTPWASSDCYLPTMQHSPAQHTRRWTRRLRSRCRTVGGVSLGIGDWGAGDNSPYRFVSADESADKCNQDNKTVPA